MSDAMPPPAPRPFLWAPPRTVLADRGWTVAEHVAGGLGWYCEDSNTTVDIGEGTLDVQGVHRFTPTELRALAQLAEESAVIPTAVADEITTPIELGAGPEDVEAMLRRAAGDELDAEGEAAEERLMQTLPFWAASEDGCWTLVSDSTAPLFAGRRVHVRAPARPGWSEHCCHGGVWTVLDRGNGIWILKRGRVSFGIEWSARGNVSVRLVSWTTVPDSGQTQSGSGA